MEQFDAAIIGFGTAGRALGGALADAGQNIAVVEQSDTMYGGACVNNACIPTKSLVESARLSAAIGGPITQREERYTAAVDDMDELRTASRMRNYHALADRSNVSVIDGRASFVDASHLRVSTASGTRDIEAKRVFIDTGSLPKLPSIPGVDSPRVFVSSSLIDLRELPRQLVIIGGGYVGLEFASFYTDFGAQVTILQDGDAILAHEDPETAEAVRKSLEDRGVTIVYNADVTSIDDEHDQVLVFAQVNGEEKRYPAHAALVAIGRTPNTAGLNLEAAGVELTERGGIKVDEHLRTTADNVWAMGDVAGGMQFTYIAYDDFRIVASDLLGDGSRTTKNRGAIPYCTFVHPPFARVGMTADEAREAGHAVNVYALPAEGISQAHILRDPVGLMKAVVDADSNVVLGMDLFCEDAQELVNTVKLVMDARIPASVLQSAVFSHPSMTEAFNNLFTPENLEQ